MARGTVNVPTKIDSVLLVGTTAERPQPIRTDEYTKLLLHLDSDFKDACGGTVTANGNAAISTEQSKFGSGSLKLDGNGDYLRGATYVFGTSDFTIEAWIYMLAMPTSDSWPSSWSNHMVIGGVGTYGLADGAELLLGATKLIFQSNDSQLISGVHGITTGSWHHVAITRSGNTFKLFVDGTTIATVTSSNSMGTGNYFWIGCEAGEGAWFNGYIDEFRLSSCARWTADFTPPASAYDWSSILLQAGAQYFDTTIGKPIWSNGTNWVDATGTTV